MKFKKRSIPAPKRWMVFIVTGLLMALGTAWAQQPDDRRPDELKRYLDLESKNIDVKLEQILHLLYETNQKVITLSFIQRYGDEIKMERAMVPNADGDLVPSWVFTPVKREKGKRYPAVVAVHGGFHYS
ncbi:MAG: hypothetical protein HKN15_12945, partial [Xanthomonadales bacterium]|nr:hypothetical protein [Xanthomonadales bacterium]